jgi:hypothetical protein
MGRDGTSAAPRRRARRVPYSDIYPDIYPANAAVGTPSRPASASGTDRSSGVGSGWGPGATAGRADGRLRESGSATDLSGHPLCAALSEGKHLEHLGAFQEDSLDWMVDSTDINREAGRRAVRARWVRKATGCLTFFAIDKRQ